MLPHHFFKLLSDETRVRCLLLIAREDAICVAELTAALSVSQPKVSRHLALLRAAGVVIDERKGQWVYYRLETHLPGWMNKQIQGLVNSNCLALQYQKDSNALSEYRAQVLCC